MKCKSVGILTLSLLLGACAANKQAPVAAPIDPATIKLAEAADSVSESLLELAKIQEVALPPKRKILDYPPTLELTNRASVDWSGPIGPLVDRIAHVAHYRMRVLGNPPAIPVLVSISAHNARLGDILRDADFQVGKRADISIIPKSKTIELRYAKT